MKELTNSDARIVSGGTGLVVETAAAMAIGSYTANTALGALSIIGTEICLLLPSSAVLAATGFAAILGTTAGIAAPFVAGGMYLDSQGELGNAISYAKGISPFC